MVADLAAARTTETVAPAGGRSRPRWQPWAALALFAFLLNFAWEMLQAPLYRGMADAAHWAAVRTCTVATVGDVGILLVAYGLVAAVARQRWWAAMPTARRVAGFVAAGLVMTVALEALNVYVLERWAYGPRMPLLVGIGIAPVLQWLVLPPLTLWLARRHLGHAACAVCPPPPVSPSFTEIQS